MNKSYSVAASFLASSHRPLNSPRLIVAASLIFVLSEALPAAAQDQKNIVSKWNSVLLNEIILNKSAPFENTRQIALLNLSLYDAIEAVEQKYELFDVKLAPVPDASAEAAAVAAGYTVLSGLFPQDNWTNLSSTYYHELSRIPDGQAKSKGITLGVEVAKQLLGNRKDDGTGDQFKNYSQVQPLALSRPDQFPLPPPPTRTSAEYSADINQSKDLGERDSKVRTPDQTEIALFWSNTGVGTYGSAGHFTRVAQLIADQKNLSNAEEARLLALVGVALADSAVSSVYWKIQYKTQRPVDLIRAGDQEAKLVRDTDWKPLSPEIFYDYPSTLTTYAGATAAVLQSFFKTDNITFSVDSISLPGVTRSFTSISAAADEASRGRIYSGYHTPYAVRGGRDILGPAIGKFVAENFLKPNNAGKATAAAQ